LSALAVIVAALLALPVLSVGSNVLRGGTSSTWAHLVSTVLPDYIVTTLWLCAGVALLTALLGVGTAWLVTHFDFPLRRSFDWMLVLPLAMPAYVMAYAYTDLLQFVGPVQSGLRELMGWVLIALQNAFYQLLHAVGVSRSHRRTDRAGTARPCGC